MTQSAIYLSLALAIICGLGLWVLAKVWEAAAGESHSSAVRLW